MKCLQFPIGTPVGFVMPAAFGSVGLRNSDDLWASASDSEMRQATAILHDFFQREPISRELTV
jgi:hypothetical protein